jgi:hypothetical protein
MRRSLAKFSESEASNQTPSLAGFIITMSGFKFSVHTASAVSPGQQFRENGPVTGTTGASGYAPGKQMQTNGPVTGSPGASGYAPGKLKN